MNNFKKALNYVLLFEGGYSNHKHDKGGATNYGITEKVARDNGYLGSMKNIPIEKVEEIYFNNYYKNNNIDKLPNVLAFSVFDFAVNGGVKRASLTLQKAINKAGIKIAVDGIIGAETLEAINKLSLKVILKAFHDEQKAFYFRIVNNNKSQVVFLKGWLNRLNNKIKLIEKWER